MTAPNHALTGALIGLTVSNPWLALPLAFLSHFACDAIPHYDPPPVGDTPARIRSKRFIYEQLVAGGLLCLLIVLALGIVRPENWLAAAVCAFLAASPDLFWMPRFLSLMLCHKDKPPHTPFHRFHSRIQWKAGKSLWWVEAAWLTVFGTIFIIQL